MSAGAPPRDLDVEQWNDSLAAEHDIDDYYARSGLVIRLIERQRLRILRALVAPKPGEALLEVGCGGGHVLRLFPECVLTGVDVSGRMLDKARRNLTGYRVRLLKGELDTLALAPASFDAVICTEVLEHTVDPVAVLGAIARLVRPSGRVAITLPNDHLLGALKRGVERAHLQALPPFRRISWGGDHYHFHRWRLHEMRALVGRFFRVTAERHAPSGLLPIRCCFLGQPLGAAGGRRDAP